MQQNHPDSTLPNSKLMNCKHRRCEYIQEPQIYKQQSVILPTFLTNPRSRANTFNRFLDSSLTLALPQAMHPDVNCNLTWLATGAAEKVCNQSNLLPAKQIYSSIYTFLESSSSICLRPPFPQALFNSDLFCSSLLPTPKSAAPKLSS
jgi:hypothetical protein